MMNKKVKIISISLLLLLISIVLIGTYSYFRRSVNGIVTGNTGNLVLIVNEANSELNETFTIPLNTNVEYVMPGERDVVYLDIDSTGSSGDVVIEIEIERTNLPDNLKFYLDKNLTEELTSMSFRMFKSDSMTKQIPIYWYWDAGIDSDNDSLFINKEVEATINVTARTIGNNFYEQLLSSATIDTDVDFRSPADKKYIESDQCYELWDQCYENSEYCQELEEQCVVPNGNGLMMRDGTQNAEYPIVYYRGDVTNNNVIFGGFCWLIVRTTETGGIKLIYNGEINEDGSCNNYSGVGGATASTYSDAYIQTSMFNPNDYSPVYVGYMYNDTRHYVIDYIFNKSEYATHLADNTVDSETGRHTQNLKDSTIKGVIDEWYTLNIDGKPEESLLEDTVWCNDRSVISEIYTIENYSLGNEVFDYGATTRLLEWTLDNSSVVTVSPSLTCARDMDKFTVDSANGNGDLTYPVGMLTADEIVLAGNAFQYAVDLVTTYVTIPEHYFWTLSPLRFYFLDADVFVLKPNGLYFDDSRHVDYSDTGVRPSISLKPGIKISDGDGSFEKPYQIY